MKIKSSATETSSIVAMGSRLVKAMKETDQEYLMLNRGVNSVVNIDLSSVVKNIDFNSTDIQVYPATNGKIELRKAINEEFFAHKADINNILITGGGISGLDICFQNIDVEEVLFPTFYWGTYSQLTKLRKLPYSCYTSYAELNQNAASLKGKAVIICDPGNPLGDKYPDDQLIALIKNLDSHGVVVMFDSPYRRLFYDSSDTLYQQLLPLQNVIIIESFSKSLGLSGQRLGFIHSCNSNFNKEALLRLLYATNGINAFAQVLITQLLISPEGKKVVRDFKMKTTTDIAKNLNFLKTQGLLATELYAETEALGIFAVLNRSTEELFKHRIGSVSLDYFVKDTFEGMENYSRVLVSYPNEKFVSFFREIGNI